MSALTATIDGDDRELAVGTTGTEVFQGRQDVIVMRVNGEIASNATTCGTPIANAIGPIEVTKLIEPGRLTDPMVVTSATASPAIKTPGVSSTPVSLAT